MLDAPLDNEQELLVVKRLGEVVVGALPDRLDGRSDRPVRGQDDPGSLRRNLVDPRERLDAVHLRHLEVHDGEMGSERACKLDCAASFATSGALISGLRS